MTIAEVGEKCKSWWATRERLPRDLAIVTVLVLASMLSFGLGYLTGTDEGQGSGGASVPTGSPDEPVVASRSGTKYYPLSCVSARISPGNKLYFGSAKEAEAAGYSLATNCAPN